MANPPILEVTGLQKSYKKRPVVRDVDMTIDRAEIAGLLGPNGAGKTTTFYMIAGLVPPDGGRVIFDGQDITSLPMHKRARLGLGYLPQEESIFRKLTVRDNLLAVLETTKLTRADRAHKADSLLDRFGITHVEKAKAMTLSGGEKRRLSIARCLCTDPRLLLLDEPFVGIDPLAVKEIHGIVRQLQEEDGLSILITDHQVRETLQITNRCSLLVAGEVVFRGSPEEMLSNPQARSLYLGKDFKA